MIPNKGGWPDLHDVGTLEEKKMQKLMACHREEQIDYINCAQFASPRQGC